MTYDQRLELQALAVNLVNKGDDWNSSAIRAAVVEIDRLRAELAAAKAEPPCPAAIVRLCHPMEIHTFDREDDANRFIAMIEARRFVGSMRTEGEWTHHPAAQPEGENNTP